MKNWKESATEKEWKGEECSNALRLTTSVAMHNNFIADLRRGLWKSLDWRTARTERPTEDATANKRNTQNTQTQKWPNIRPPIDRNRTRTPKVAPQHFKQNRIIVLTYSMILGKAKNCLTRESAEIDRSIRVWICPLPSIQPLRHGAVGATCWNMLLNALSLLEPFSTFRAAGAPWLRGPLLK